MSVRAKLNISCLFQGWTAAAAPDLILSAASKGAQFMVLLLPSGWDFGNGMLEVSLLLRVRTLLRMKCCFFELFKEMGSRCCTGARSRYRAIFQRSRHQTTFFWPPVPHKDSILTVSVRGLMWFGVQVAVYVCFIWSLDLEVFDWGLKLIGVVHSPPCWLVTVLKTCFSTSQPEGSATKYIHIFITWSNWNRTWLWHHFVPAMSRVVPSSFFMACCV